MALLADCNFYPRSPCGERPSSAMFSRTAKNFYPRSPCGERPSLASSSLDFIHISIHALLAESDSLTLYVEHSNLRFLSTLSLRRATHKLWPNQDGCIYFYPRSPCGERPWKRSVVAARENFYPRSPCGERPSLASSSLDFIHISIHALLAESDSLTLYVEHSNLRFLSTLSLRRATHKLWPNQDGCIYFYPRSPCGERPWALRLRPRC